MAEDEEFKNAVSMVRLPFKPSARDKVDVSPEWYETMAKITKEPNFRYVARGEGVDDTCDVMLMVGWIDGARPSAAFVPAGTSTAGSDSTPAGSSGLDTILAPLQPFLSERPRVTTLSHRRNGASPNFLTTAFRGTLMEPMKEVLMVRGRASRVEPVMKAIATAFREYTDYREGATFSGGSRNYLFNGAILASLDDTYGSSREHDAPASFALILTWSNREGRTKFQDPTLPDLTLTPGMRPSEPFWQEKVAKPLQALVEQGATISSWDYHRTALVKDDRGLPILGKGETVW
ncbi:hypothetical protein QQZ08_003021 [Neonectria magnoliae]|uniref:Uncharacterized protein n=1 Tax=Neonectria magnoliae TaxID=2732573 RepID=A0ABR1ICH0_9HYPO